MSSATLTSLSHGPSLRIETVRSRIQRKMQDYAAYGFSASESCAINIFFDLAQEFEDIEHVHLLAVLILHMFFQYDAELHLKDEADRPIRVSPAITSSGTADLREIRSEIWNDGLHCHVPVYGKKALGLSEGRFSSDETPMGVLIIYARHELESHERLFLKKYANRVGFCLDNKILALRNARHVLFLRKLAHDIGHNIITPNLRLKLMLGRLESQISDLHPLFAACVPEANVQEKLAGHLQKMTEQVRDILGTFQNSALFLESLLRQSHFDLGRYVLRPARIDICERVVTPQFERFRPLFEEGNVLVSELQPELPSSRCLVEADFGLLSQVLANLLANAVKYAAPHSAGAPRRVRCAVEILPDAFDTSAPGVKVSVFSSGPPVPPEEAGHLFDDNFRASNASGQYGTGHGLFFVREIMAEHKGLSGYEPCEEGNIFYFILPLCEDCP